MNVMEHYEKMNYCPNCKKAKALEIIKEHWTYNKLGFIQIKPIAIEDANLLKEILYESRTND